MPERTEDIQLRRDAVANPGLAFISDDGHTLVVSYDGRNCLVYQGPDFNAMSEEEYQSFFDRMNQTD